MAASDVEQRYGTRACGAGLLARRGTYQHAFYTLARRSHVPALLSVIVVSEGAPAHKFLTEASEGGCRWADSRDCLVGPRPACRSSKRYLSFVGDEYSARHEPVDELGRAFEAAFGVDSDVEMTARRGKEDGAYRRLPMTTWSSSTPTRRATCVARPGLRTRPPSRRDVTAPTFVPEARSRAVGLAQADRATATGGA
jgi:hypothetical protein